MADTRILVVDDEAAILDMLREFLGDCGYEVVTASNAIEAEVLLESDSIDLALLDVGVHGLRLAEKANAVGKSFILMSGAPVVVEMGEFGEVLRKPFQLGALRRAVARMLGDPAQRSARLRELGAAGVPG